MKKLWVIGAGKFGTRAVEILSKKNFRFDITIVDRDINSCRKLDKLSCRVICMDGIEYLSKNLTETDSVDWIIPAAPVHVAYEWIRAELKKKYFVEGIDVPEGLAKSLPNVITGSKGEIYISYADFICPDNCPEPADKCTYTNKPRIGILHKKLESIKFDSFKSVVIQSRQLAPGAGGYTPKDLFDALDMVLINAHTPILLSTACKCHGVMHAFRISDHSKNM